MSRTLHASALDQLIDQIRSCTVVCKRDYPIPLTSLTCIGDPESFPDRHLWITRPRPWATSSENDLFIGEMLKQGIKEVCIEAGSAPRSLTQTLAIVRDELYSRVSSDDDLLDGDGLFKRLIALVNYAGPEKLTL